ncbi:MULTISPECIES: hypothetical protein [Amycolatopsis]|uniref:LppX_LprAFG lipoprotein n=1 Tax=Amycolatopsis tucumanensis TaxID=401106 RepID=A0ABP7IPA0_9PSEU|nr:hypothetical protein [Amycolatopsis tucumanensis]MCF6428023.1 hypothetical protein [Amycolatopsis tucumanensis]
MRKIALLAGALALVAGTTACGSTAESGQAGETPALFGNAQELVLASSGKTSQAQTAKFTLTGSVAGQTLNAGGEGRFTGPSPAMTMTMTVAGQSQEMRVVDKVLYLKLPPEQAAQAVEGGKPWAKVPEDSEAGKAIGASMDQAAQGDPTQILDQIQQAGTITRSEQTTLDGQPVSHYWVNLDVAKATGTLNTGELPPEVLDKLKNSGAVIPVEIWLNSDQLPVQVTQDLTQVMQAAGAPAGAQSATMTMKYRDWGAPVDVTAPPADQVGELKTAA